MDITAYRKHPGISLDQHVKQRVVELGKSLEQRVPVYLDTKFWIILRDSASGARTDAPALDLLQRLRRLVGNGTIFCPISDSAFSEFMKRGDLLSRLAIARIVDELSLGVTCLDSRTRMRIEIAHFVHGFQNDGHELHPLHHLVWSKLAYVLGFVHPNETPFDAETELAIQKAFFDHMWGQSLETMMTTIGTASPPDGLHFDTSDLNRGVEEHAHELKSFEQCYEAEIRGSVELGAELAMDITGELFREKTAEPPPERGSAQWQKFWSQWANLLFTALTRRPEIRQQLRMLHIYASLHAAFRWNKARRFKSNDLYDFEHASAALAHCRAFFTESALHATITARNIALDTLFQCRVASEIEDAISVLKEIEAARGELNMAG
ncbi:hypothetical protein HL668_05790 [Bradyrhizobium sp. 81013]|nr:hypothetical protein [Bradyrhizobium aeschynomenes]